MSLANIEKNIEKLMHDTWNVMRPPLPDDNIRVIWFGDGRLQHAHTLYKSIQTVHGDIWSWRHWEPEVMWMYHMRLNHWMSSTRYGTNNEIIQDVLKADVPKDIELYNALLGE